MKLTATLAALAMSVASLSAVPLSPETILLCQGPNAGTISVCETYRKPPYPSLKVWRTTWNAEHTIYVMVSGNIGPDWLGFDTAYLHYKGITNGCSGGPCGGAVVYVPNNGQMLDMRNWSNVPMYLTPTRSPDAPIVTLWNAYANYVQGSFTNAWNTGGWILDALRKLYH